MMCCFVIASCNIDEWRMENPPFVENVPVTYNRFPLSMLIYVNLTEDVQSS